MFGSNDYELYYALCDLRVSCYPLVQTIYLMNSKLKAGYDRPLFRAARLTLELNGEVLELHKTILREHTRARVSE
jgi:hypothetical protein